MNLRHKVRNGTTTIGTMLQDYRSPRILPILDELNFDFVVLDQEHSGISFSDIELFATAARDLDISLLVRPTKISYEYIARALDMGADGLMIPHVDTVEQVKKIINSAKYPPIGKRSYGMRKELCGFGPFDGTADYLKKANEHSLILIQIESPTGLQNKDELIKSEDIDGVIIGPADLTMNMAIPGQYSNEIFTESCESVLKTCSKNRKGFGIHFGSRKLSLEWVEKGTNIVLFSTITKMAEQSASEFILEIKKKSPHKTLEGDTY